MSGDDVFSDVNLALFKCEEHKDIPGANSPEVSVEAAIEGHRSLNF